ncbi:hypothetical protein JTB14_018705 [Gonioctena quinquepunctata]|nr:hypothetical protein JTB14_018705 [Gonioctena quinquepunctata]
MSEQRFNRYLSLYQIAILIYFLLDTCSGLHCDESASTEYIYNEYGYSDREIVADILFTCADVYLPMSTVRRENACNSCPITLKILSSQNSIVPSSAFSNFSFITILRMENINLEKLLPGAFNTLNSLKEVYLSGNNIKDLSPGIFNSLLELRILDLSRNQLKSLGRSCLSGATHLRKIDLSWNSLITFEDSVLDQNILELEYMDLSFNNITQLEIKNVHNKILTIDMSSNKISVIDFCVSGFKKLRISKNELKSLGQVNCSDVDPKITDLDISFNQIYELSSDTFINLTQLQNLSLAFNNISFLPTGLFSNVHSLVVLNVSSNDLDQFLPGTFEHLESLQILDLSNNKITAIKRYLHSLGNLTELNIQQNRISDLESAELVADLPKLSRISLDNNNFTCDDLIEIIHDFRSKNIRITYGHAKKTSNIYGISCLDNSNSATKFPEDIGSNIEKIIQSKLGQLSDGDFKRSAMYNYFNEDFKNSNFFKYLENLQTQKSLKFNDSEVYHYFNEDFLNSNLYKYLETIRDAKNFSIEFNKSLHGYFNNDFKNSGFVKYLDNLKRADGNLNEGFSNSAMNNFSNGDFEKSRFYTYLQNLKFPQMFTSSTIISDSKFGDFVINPKEDMVGDTVRLLTVAVILLVVAVVLWVVIAIILMILTWIVHKNSDRKKRKNERIELIDT